MASLNVTDEVMEMMQIAMSIYVLADLRLLAKNQKLPEEAAKCVLELPIPASQIGILYSKHIAAIKALHGDDVDMYLTAAPDIQKLSLLSSPMTQPLSSGLPPDSAFGEAEIYVFDDENSKSELVYAMGVNR
jgi:hypothetical protein